MFLINEELIISLLREKGINVTGVFHLGAHEAEEIGFYVNKLNLGLNDILWIDALPKKVKLMLDNGIPNVYNAIITNEDDKNIIFNVSNNYQSSSILRLKTHLQEYPDIIYTARFRGKSVTIDTFFKRNNIDPSKYNFWNFDIQGAELLALKGAEESIQNVKAIYLEVNEKELYENCALIGEIDEFLLKHNFERITTTMTQHGWGDALYVKKNV
jgi:FkbM family methyltransferase